ncbi:uncharacterized protein LOC110984127 [Acanthaster planci]|uniref:Uncharacterized protein LOC110984127 n=1 Tax=Acanthaster planci TaxID=133434 RepID=A0A8B7Z4D7_ACAPL|nr:uncharacterized protein LOC110984127 [Acanthaster planci]
MIGPVVLFLAAAVAAFPGAADAAPPDPSMSVVRMLQANEVRVDEVAWTGLSDGQSLYGGSPCSCQGKECGCCQSVKIPALGINSKACANVTFLSEQIGAKLSLSIDGKVIFDQTVSVKNPEPICKNFKGRFQICGELYKLSVSPEEFEACARLQAKAYGRVIATVDLGCFKIPLKEDELALVESTDTVDEWLDLSPSVSANGPCSCSHDQCQCCQRIKIKAIKINNNICIKVQFLSSNIGVSLSLTIDGKTVFTKTLSLKNPPPICEPLGVGKVCISLYDLSLTKDALSGCGRLQAKLLGKTVATVKLGCFKIPLHLALYGRSPEVEGILHMGDLAEALAGPVMGGELTADNFPLTIALEPYLTADDGEN